MPRSVDLMAVGFSWPQTLGIGNDSVSIAGAGATQGSATLFNEKNEIALFTASSSTACGMVFSSNAPLGSPNYVVMLSTTPVTGTVYCPVGATMNGTANGSVVLTTGKTATFIQTAQSVWVSIPLTP